MTFKQLLKTTDAYIAKLASVGIASPLDLLWHLPRTYEDRTKIKTIDQLVMDGSVQTIKVKVTKKSLVHTAKNKKLVEIHGVDEKEQRVTIRFLNMTYILRSVFPDSRYYVIGVPQYDKGQWMYRHPEIVPAAATTASEAHSVGSIYPIYSELQGISPSWFYKKIFDALDGLLATVQDPLPAEFLETQGLPGLREMFQILHAPENFDQIAYAKQRIYFTKLLQRQLTSLVTKLSYQQSQPTTISDWELVKTFVDRLSFALTTAQKRCIKQTIEEMDGPVTMMKLLQGDVGSGKTVVAAAAAWYVTQKFGGQVVFLAPLEVLAQQQYRSLAKLFLPLGVRVELLTGSVKASEKQRLKAALAAGQIPVIVGTHALLQDDIFFSNLKFAVIDEQHKFGVKQRGFFQQFGSPHIMQMTATPIPRSLALAFFGEFTVSTIDEMPAGRKSIITKIVSESEWHRLKPRVLTKISQGQRVFVITPLIEESDFLDEVKSAKQQYEVMKGLFEHDIRVMKMDSSTSSEGQDHGSWTGDSGQYDSPIGLLHGKMKSSEKDEIMKQFKEGGIDMLVSTTVIEVGIDIPEATVMIIMNAERFGLSQLHQLRGRVGRSDLQSYCFLETKNKSGDTYQRLHHMETTSDGFKLAELDLQLRGAGEFLGTRQSGETDIPVEVLTDMQFIERVQQAAEDLMKNHPQVASGLLSNEDGGMPVLA